MAKVLQYDDQVTKIALYAKALGHPARVYIMKVLSNQLSCYSGDLANEIPIARSTLSRHLKELKMAGLIQGEINPPYIKYCVNRKNWDEAKKLFNEYLK